MSTEKQIKYLILFFIIAIMVSGITAFPVHTEMNYLMNNGYIQQGTILGDWLYKVWLAVNSINQSYPFLFYGYDWLAFAHIMIGILFIGVYNNPVKNKWVINWGLICCASVIPLAFICGPIRGIPMLHIIIDCSFGVFGAIPLLYVGNLINQLEKSNHSI